MARIKLSELKSAVLESIDMPDGAVWRVRRNSPVADFIGMAAYSAKMREGTGKAILERVIAVAREVVVEWENMETEEGPLECTPDNVELVLRNVPGFAMQFYLKWEAVLENRNQEGNVSDDTSRGRSVEEVSTVPPVVS